ncbi:hypothetical protein [Roseofilum casamattae]|uniref:Uncharacterized protein n=1 Tax=Roseofilum casamattae BLCC-M143 TaxID=3022442 RepID=A0ABT7BZR2_9CYAN|nr:hypothetical protein [Roseofilum casamattae]MDJ1184691.1 hypothetical protein [Roseofilum casamattae BLCC-M143]
MIAIRQRKMWIALFTATLLLVSACASEPPSRFEQTQQESTQRNAAPAVVKEAVAGSTFNRFFPKSGGGYDVVPAQEKKGFAEYKLKQSGKDVAVLSINDTINLPAAKKKYEQSTQRISGFPAVTQGKNITGVLVADRFQVKAQSRDTAFTASDRQTWLQKFDLQGLSRVK